MNAPELPGRILAAVAKATSSHPARATDVLALVGGEEPAFWAEIDQLYALRRINTAYVQRKGDVQFWLAIWPTGVCLPVPPMSGNSFAGLFVKHRPDDLYAAHAPRSTPTPAAAPKPAPAPKPVSTKEAVMPTATTPHRAKGSLQTAVTDLLRGRDRAAALTVADVADKLDDTTDNIRFPLRALAAQGGIAETTQVAGRRKVRAYYDPATDSRAVSEAALTDVPDNPRSPPAATGAPCVERRAPQPLYRDGDMTVSEIPAVACAEQIEFALWDDGRLTIAAGDEITLIPPDATRRLALLLGVPGNQPVSTQGA